MADLKVDITIKDHTTGDYVVVPVLPESIPYTLGDKEADTVNILSIGEVDFLRGKKLDTFDLVSFFPARYDPSYCVTSRLKKPLEYRKLFNDWKNNGTTLQIICPAAGINAAMTLRSFVPELRGFEGDIHYTASFKQHKVVKPKKINLAAAAPPSKKASAADRPQAPAQAKPKTYTVKRGDSLTRIAKQLGIKDWRKDLYNPNKSVIGPNPDDLKPGQVLRIV